MVILNANADNEVVVKEQGELKFETISGTFGGTGVKNRDFEVPTGKVWEIKAVSSSSAATALSAKFLLHNGSAEVPVHNAGANAGYQVNLGNHKFVIPYGWKFRANYNISVDGNTVTALVIREYDA